MVPHPAERNFLRKRSELFILHSLNPNSPPCHLLTWILAGKTHNAWTSTCKLCVKRCYPSVRKQYRLKKYHKHRHLRKRGGSCAGNDNEMGQKHYISYVISSTFLVSRNRTIPGGQKLAECARFLHSETQTKHEHFGRIPPL